MARPLLVSLGLVIGVSGCWFAKPFEQRTTEGPSAEQAFAYRVSQQNGREPTFDERQTWNDDLDLKVARYLDAHPEDANSFSVTKFRSLRQTAVGMSKEQVTILLGPPVATTTEADRMADLGRKYWSHFQDRPTEAWSYPGGWSLFFVGDRIVDITQFLP